MSSKAFATAVGMKVADLACGPKFVTAGGAVEVPMGAIRERVKFVLSCGTPHEHRVVTFVTVGDTLVYCALLGMEFNRGRMI